ncbi:MAG TPA: HAMP domain-containing sensor histidine kinase [Solirubrobacterales bacterium]|nr:HAMP domain-containing sensor histidine kinase [Solirubrobacterales bacterium]
MKRLERLLAALTPKRWPVRWRLAAVSAALTLIILVVFAVVVGRLTSNRLQSDFNDDVRSTAFTIARETQVDITPLGRRVEITPHQLERMAVPLGSGIQIVYQNGEPIEGGTIGTVPDVGPPAVDDVKHVGDLSVAAYPLASTIQSSDPLFVQYARSTDSLEATINRLWLFLAGGVVGGTLLAALAGIAIAGRAMRPVSTLTTRAREIASTRDPSLRIPEPETDDEVGELARTLEQMLRQLDAARSETEQMMQAQREFVADASHELRTPLTSILANLELLQERLEATEQRGEEGEMISSALSSARRMSRLISDLLLLARADAGRTSARRECDLAAVAAAALSEVRPVADGHRLTLAERGPVPVEGNPDELHRLAVNLLDNGLRHTPAGTEIRIAVERRNGDAVLEVSDDGPGIPAGMEALVFSRFVRGGGPADAAGDTGTGLGLAIVKAVAVSHHGEVDAGSSPAGGARFTVRLPLPTP